VTFHICPSMSVGKTVFCIICFCLMFRTFSALKEFYDVTFWKTSTDVSRVFRRVLRLQNVRNFPNTDRSRSCLSPFPPEEGRYLSLRNIVGFKPDTMDSQACIFIRKIINYVYATNVDGRSVSLRHRHSVFSRFLKINSGIATKKLSEICSAVLMEYHPVTRSHSSKNSTSKHRKSRTQGGVLPHIVRV
jgi:hypothetical protein